MEFEKVLEASNGTMAKFSKVNGKTARKTDTGYGNLRKETTMRGIGSSIDNTAKVFTSIK